jgi:hypothetical protein
MAFGGQTKAGKKVRSPRGVINGKAGKAAVLPKFSSKLTLFQPVGADYTHPLALPHIKNFRDYDPAV